MTQSNDPQVTSAGAPLERSPSRPVGAPAIWMDQEGNYWRVYPKGSLPGTDEQTLSIVPTSEANYEVHPVEVYRTGRDLSAQEAQELLSRIYCRTDDPLLKRAADSAWHAWTTGRDMVTEAEILLRMVAAQVGAEPAENGHSDGTAT